MLSVIVVARTFLCSLISRTRAWLCSAERFPLKKFLVDGHLIQQYCSGLSQKRFGKPSSTCCLHQGALDGWSFGISYNFVAHPDLCLYNEAHMMLSVALTAAFCLVIQSEISSFEALSALHLPVVRILLVLVFAFSGHNQWKWLLPQKTQGFSVGPMSLRREKHFCIWLFWIGSRLSLCDREDFRHPSDILSEIVPWSRPSTPGLQANPSLPLPRWELALFHFWMSAMELLPKSALSSVCPPSSYDSARLSASPVVLGQHS